MYSILQGRNWVFTLNNPDYSAEELLALFKEHRHFRFVIFQEEVGANGTRHFQGYSEFKSNLFMTAVKKILATAHWELRRGTQAQAVAYSEKEDTRVSGPYTAGVQGGSQGRRSDIHDAVDVLISTRSIRDVIIEHPVAFVKYHRGMQRLLEVTVAPRMDAPKCILLYGPTGTGKSHWAYTKFPGAYWKAPNSKWFDGYLDETVVVMDEFVGKNEVSLTTLLRLMDKYPLKVEVKGSSRDFLATTLIFTTNIHPRKWYGWESRESQWPALQRRFDEIWYLPEPFCVPKYLSKKSFFLDWSEYCNEDDVFQTVTRPNTPVASVESEDEDDEMSEELSLDSDEEFDFPSFVTAGDEIVSAIRRIHPVVIGPADVNEPLVGCIVCDNCFSDGHSTNVCPEFPIGITPINIDEL